MGSPSWFNCSIVQLFHYYMSNGPEKGSESPEKKKIDEAFWDKFKEFQTMPPEERVSALRKHLALYERESGIGMKMDVYSWLFTHPERCRLGAVLEEWMLDRRADFSHNPEYKDDFLNDWERISKNLQRKINILNGAAIGDFPADEELKPVLTSLHQGTGQHIMALFTVLKAKGIPKDEVEELQWLGSMSQEKLKKVIWDSYDSARNEVEEKGYRDATGEDAEQKLVEEIQKWREQQKEHS